MVGALVQAMVASHHREEGKEVARVVKLEAKWPADTQLVEDQVVVNVAREVNREVKKVARKVTREEMELAKKVTKKVVDVDREETR